MNAAALLAAPDAGPIVVLATARTFGILVTSEIVVIIVRSGIWVDDADLVHVATVAFRAVAVLWVAFFAVYASALTAVPNGSVLVTVAAVRALGIGG